MEDVLEDERAAGAGEVALNLDTFGTVQLDVAHRPNGNRRLRTLDDYRDAIEVEISGLALRIGKLLIQAKAAHPRRFERWVEDELPFGIDKARRLMLISRAYETLPAERLAELPKPWQALYALRNVPREQLLTGVRDGSISTTTTIEQARAWAAGPAGIRQYHPADVAAGALLNHSPDDLSPSVLGALVAWLDGVRPLTVDELRSDADTAGVVEGR